MTFYIVENGCLFDRINNDRIYLRHIEAINVGLNFPMFLVSLLFLVGAVFFLPMAVTVWWGLLIPAALLGGLGVTAFMVLRSESVVRIYMVSGRVYRYRLYHQEARDLVIQLRQEIER